MNALRLVIQMSFESSVARRRSRRDTLSAVLCARPGPWHEIINARGWPQIDQFGQNVLDVGLRINTVELAGLCRPPNYAERFWMQPVAPAHLQASSGLRPGAIRHSLAIYSASRKASRRSFARKRVGLPRW
jgi:hypothetical protein